MTTTTSTAFTIVARRLALFGLFMTAFVLAASAARAQTATCGSHPNPVVLFAPPTTGADSGISPSYVRLLAGVVESGIISPQQRRVEFVLQRHLADLAELARQRQLLGSDEDGAELMQELAGAAGGTDWMMTMSVSALGSARIVNMKLLDLRRGAAIVRSRSATLPTGIELGLLDAEIASMARGLDCQLRSLRMTPVIPLLQLAVSPQPARGKPGDAMTVTVRLVDLAAGSAPEPNKDIVLEYTTPQGQKHARTVRTDSSGVANDTLVLGPAHPRAGLIKARFVRSDGYPRDAVPLNYYVTAPTGDLNLSTGKAQLLPTGTDTVRAELKHNAAPVPNHAVNVGVTGGTLASASVITNSAGVASVQFAAPGRAALVDVNASTTLPAGAGNAQAAVSYVVDPGVVMSLQSGGDTLIFGGSSVKVDLERDRQPVVGATVTFTLAGGGTLSAPSVATDTVGRAEVVFAAPSRQGATTVSASVTLDGQTYTRSVTMRYTDPTDAITREIADVKEAMWLNPSDATLTRLNTLRSALLARGESSRAESLLADQLVQGPLSCVQERAHRECAAALRTKGEATLGLVKGITNGSTGLDWLYSRAKDSLRVCPYTPFVDRSVYVPAATIDDIVFTHTVGLFFSISRWGPDDRPSHFYFDAHDETGTTNRFVRGSVPVGGAGPTYSATIADGDLFNLWGNRFLLLDYQRNATAPTVSISINGTQVSGSFALYRGEYNGVEKTAVVSFSTTVTLPPAPEATMCNQRALPQPGTDGAPPGPATRR